jgi:octaprenyl-diphosphate synthase
LLDITGDEGQAGKTLGRDVAKNKPTLALIHLLSTVGEGEKNALIDSLCVKGGANVVEGKGALAEKLRSSGSLEYTRGMVREFVARAVEGLDGLKEGGAKQALIETAKYIGQRAKQI